jgi:hypothetical protein
MTTTTTTEYNPVYNDGKNRWEMIGMLEHPILNREPLYKRMIIRRLKDGEMPGKRSVSPFVKESAPGSEQKELF